MLLHDSLDDAVADVLVDLPALAESSRRRGLSIRRRRRALATVGATAIASALAVGVWALAPGGDGPERLVATDAPAPVATGALSGEVAPITGRGAAAALVAAVDEVADGAFGGLQGSVHDGEAMAAVRFLPGSGTGPAGLVMINLQPLGAAGPAPYTCAELGPPLVDCQAWQLPSGDTVRTYRDEDTEAGAGSVRNVVEVISPERGLRLVVGAMNTHPYAGGEMRAEPVLTTDRLVEVATRPWWDRRELPAELVAAGEDLQDYADADG